MHETTICCADIGSVARGNFGCRLFCPPGHRSPTPGRFPLPTTHPRPPRRATASSADPHPRSPGIATIAMPRVTGAGHPSLLPPGSPPRW